MSGSARYFTAEISALKKEDEITPARMSISIPEPRFKLLSRKVTPTAAIPIIIAISCVPSIPKEKRIPRAAPNAAPEDTPNVSGEASGFAKIDWKQQPATDNPAPTMKAKITLGSRDLYNIVTAGVSNIGPESKADMTSLKDRPYLPTHSASKADTKGSVIHSMFKSLCLCFCIAALSPPF